MDPIGIFVLVIFLLLVLVAAVAPNIQLRREKKEIEADEK